MNCSCNLACLSSASIACLCSSVSSLSWLSASVYWRASGCCCLLSSVIPLNSLSNACCCSCGTMVSVHCFCFDRAASCSSSAWLFGSIRTFWWIWRTDYCSRAVCLLSASSMAWSVVMPSSWTCCWSGSSCGMSPVYLPTLAAALKELAATPCNSGLMVRCSSFASN